MLSKKKSTSDCGKIIVIRHSVFHHDQGHFNHILWQFSIPQPKRIHNLDLLKVLQKKSSDESPSSSPSNSGFRSLRMAEDSRSEGWMDSSAFKNSHTSLVTGKESFRRNLK